MNISALIGKTFLSVTREPMGDGDGIRFVAADGTEYGMWHTKDCCESVTIDDICGELSDLVGAPILQAEESTNANSDPDGVIAPEEDEFRESWTWTFYRFATIKGAVCIRWYGSSNGYYSESVTFAQIK